MSKAPEVCLYCQGTGIMKGADHNCGFCVEGVPLDTQEDWDKSWGWILDRLFGRENEEQGND